jgi:hypothetical protein
MVGGRKHLALEGSGRQAARNPERLALREADVDWPRRRKVLLLHLERIPRSLDRKEIIL